MITAGFCCAHPSISTNRTANMTRRMACSGIRILISFSVILSSNQMQIDISETCDILEILI